jgi:hypothetical protein
VVVVVRDDVTGGPMRALSTLCLLAICTAGVAHADDAPAATSPPTPTALPPAAPVGPFAWAQPWDVHLGLNLRTDLGVHPLRLDLGVRYGNVDATLVLDPMVLTDGQMSTDLLLQYRSDLGIDGLVGWRTTTIGALDGPQFQQNLLLGAGLELPRFFDGAVRGQWGLELAMTVVKHGGGLPQEVISFSSGRHYIDLVNFAMFARFEFGWPWGTSSSTPASSSAAAPESAVTP